MRRTSGVRGAATGAALGAVWLVAASAGFPAQASTAAAEPAITRTAQDPALAWGPCPEFLPAGCRLAVLHGDPAAPGADVLLEVPAGSHLVPHWHTSAERMVLLAGELRLTYDGQLPAVLRPGTYAYGPARRTHEAACTSAVPCLLFIAFDSPVDAVPIESERD